MEVNHLDVVFGSTNQTSQGWFHRLVSLVGVSGLGVWDGVGQGFGLFLGCFVKGKIISACGTWASNPKVQVTLGWFGMVWDGWWEISGRMH